MGEWTPLRWRSRPARQLPSYADAAALEATVDRLRDANPVVEIAACAALRDALADPARLLLQGGDCAESFDDPVGERVAALSALFEALLDRLRPSLRAEPVAVARIAGQFAKPRSAEWEERAGLRLPAYRGDIVNGLRFDAPSRAPDPSRLLRAYIQSVGAAASLDAARCGTTAIFTSHEALHLPYEEALARRDNEGRWWATSGHMLWVGDRTRQPDGAHVDFLSGVENVVGVKVGPSMTAGELRTLVAMLDPANRPGKIVLIGRFGADRIDEILPPLLRATREEGWAARWAIDPMHGNTRQADGRKLRRLSDIVAELERFVRLCGDEGVAAGGVHLEMSALDVTECIGGAGPASLADLDRNWRSACDPRLNRSQAIDVVTQFGASLAQAHSVLSA